MSPTSRQFDNNIDKIPTIHSKNSRSGQVIVEYVLLLAVSVVIFGGVFTLIRGALFDLWICDIAPRVMAPSGCGPDTQECWNSAINGANDAGDSLRQIQQAHCTN